MAPNSAEPILYIMNTLNTIQLKKAHADIFKFDNDTEVAEYHVMLHVDDPCLSFPEQLETTSSTPTMPCWKAS